MKMLTAIGQAFKAAGYQSQRGRLEQMAREVLRSHPEAKELPSVIPAFRAALIEAGDIGLVIELIGEAAMRSAVITFLRQVKSNSQPEKAAGGGHPTADTQQLSAAAEPIAGERGRGGVETHMSCAPPRKPNAPRDLSAARIDAADAIGRRLASDIKPDGIPLDRATAAATRLWGEGRKVRGDADAIFAEKLTEGMVGNMVIGNYRSYSEIARVWRETHPMEQA